MTLHNILILHRFNSNTGSTTMHFKLTEVYDDSEFPPILEVHRAAFEQPYSRLWPLLYPEPGNTPDARAAALADGVARTIQIYRSDSNSHWIKVTEADTDRVVGAARWVISTSNQFRGQRSLVFSDASGGPKVRSANSPTLS